VDGRTIQRKIARANSLKYPESRDGTVDEPGEGLGFRIRVSDFG
jgi:hypothetical protein